MPHPGFDSTRSDFRTNAHATHCKHIYLCYTSAAASCGDGNRSLGGVPGRQLNRCWGGALPSRLAQGRGGGALKAGLCSAACRYDHADRHVPDYVREATAHNIWYYRDRCNVPRGPCPLPVLRECWVQVPPPPPRFGLRGPPSTACLAALKCWCREDPSGVRACRRAYMKEVVGASLGAGVRPDWTSSAASAVSPACCPACRSSFCSVPRVPSWPPSAAGGHR